MDIIALQLLFGLTDQYGLLALRPLFFYRFFYPDASSLSSYALGSIGPLILPVTYFPLWRATSFPDYHTNEHRGECASKRADLPNFVLVAVLGFVVDIGVGVGGV